MPPRLLPQRPWCGWWQRLWVWRQFSCPDLKTSGHLQDMYRRHCKILWPLYFPSQRGKQPTQKASIWRPFLGWRSKGAEVNHLPGVAVYNRLSLTSGAKLHWVCSSYILHSLIDVSDSPTREEIKWFPERKGSCGDLRVSMQDAQGNNLGIPQLLPEHVSYDFCFSHTVCTWCDIFYLLGLIYPHCFIVDQPLFLP